jgi:D-alanyl-lipoteichoic acid acyltransferase DltB (MBOAT superfamily)
MRWHISLSRWFRDYLYIPLGGNRVARPRYYLNQVMVFLVSGLWHGANWTFVIWGGLNGLYQVVWLLARGAQAKVANPVPRPVAFGPLFALAVPFPSTVLPARPSPLLKGLLTFHLVLIAWVFFRASSVSDALTVLGRIARSLPSLPTLIASRPLSEDILLSIALITLLIVLESFEERGWLWQGLRARPVYLRWAVYYVLLGSLLVIGRWNLKQFVYMQF